MIAANFQRPDIRNPPEGHLGLFLSVGHSVLVYNVDFRKEL